MHRIRRGWNVPLGIGLFGAAALFTGAMIAYPEVEHRPETAVDVSDPIATRPFPSFPDEVPAVAGQRVIPPAPAGVAPAAIGGGPRPFDEEPKHSETVTADVLSCDAGAAP